MNKDILITQDVLFLKVGIMELPEYREYWIVTHAEGRGWENFE